MATNKFLADQLINPNVNPARTAPIFQDNREKTSVPYPFIETILPGNTGVKGQVGIYKGITWVPDVNAYIYIYINGFLVNPPSLNPDGTFQNTKTSVISDSNGQWQTTNAFFTVLPQFEYGQSIVFRAKTPLKQMSDRSVPYAIGATPAPIDLGVIGDHGELRKPYDGEYSITGRVSYWFNHETGLPNFDCNNHIYVYVDGIHAGTYGNILGEVFQNEIRGIDAEFPLNTSLNNRSLFLTVNNRPIEIPLKTLAPVDYSNLFGIIDGSNGLFWFVLPDSSATIKIYRNGIRQAEEFDYTYVIDSATKRGDITFTISSIPQQGDDLIVVFQYNISEFSIGEKPSILFDLNISKNYVLLKNKAKRASLEIYHNGVHLDGMNSRDYVFDGNNRIVFNNALDTTDIIIADYQIVTLTPLLTSVDVLYPTDKADEFTFSVITNSTGQPNIYKNGIRLKEGLFNDYTIKAVSFGVSNVIVFNPWAIPDLDEDVLLLVFYSSPIVLSEIVKYLNSTKEFADNCLVASTVGVIPIPDYENLSGIKNGINTLFGMPESELPVNYKVFKNGLRQKEKKNKLNTGDFSLDYPNSRFIFEQAPNNTDSLSTLMNYVTVNYIVGEVPEGVKNGLNSKFKLAMTPKASTVAVYFNGIRQNPFNELDYKIEGNYVRFLVALPNADDIILVDYEPSFGANTFTSSLFIPATGSPTYIYSTNIVGVAINVFVNGVLQTPIQDYTTARGSITFASSSIPVTGDNIVLEFIKTELFKISPKDQLKITSPYKLDIHKYTTTNVTSETPNGTVNSSNRNFFTLLLPIPETLVVYRNGQVVNKNTFMLSNNKITFITFIPAKGDTITVDYKSEAGYELDRAQQLLFGSDVELWPGKDDDGEFFFWFDRNNGYWKWSWVNPETKEITPFKTGQRIKARAWNKSSFTYTLPR